MTEKKILIVTECFYPEAFKINEVALAWKAQGYEVDVLTTVPTYPASEVFSGYTNRWFQKETHEGMTVYRVRAVTGYKSSLFKKILKYISFMILGSLVSLKIGKRYDYVFGYDVGALTGMVPAVLLQTFYKKPVTLWVQDIWPDSVYAFGFKKTKAKQFFLDAFVRFVYRYTTNFAISSKGFEAKIVPYLKEPRSIVYAPNWADELDTRLAPFVFSAEPKVHFTFAGNVGKVQNLENVLNAFEALLDDDKARIQLNIIGDGSYLETLKARAHEMPYVKFWGRQPRESMYAFFAGSDFLIVSLEDQPIFALTVPAKTQTYIAAHKPIIGAIKGEAASLIRENGLGYCADPEDIEGIKNILIEAIAADEETMKRFTEKSQALTQTTFDRGHIIQTLLTQLIQADA